MLVAALRQPHMVTVITGARQDANSVYPRAFVVETLRGVRVMRLAISMPSGRSMPETLLSYLFFSILCIPVMLLATRDTDCYVSLSPHPTLFLSFQVFVVSKIQRASHILHLGDLWPDGLIDVLKIKNRIAIGLIQLFHDLSFAASDVIIALTQAIKNALVRRGISNDRIIIVPMSVDASFFRPLPKNHTLLDSDLQSKIIVMYSGNFGMQYDFGALLSAAEKLTERKDIHFILRGNGMLKNSVVNAVKENCLTNVLIQDAAVGDQKLIKILNLADMFVIPMLSVPVQATALPSKVLEFMACGKPVVCSAEGELADLINKSKAGVAVPPCDSEGLTKAIISIADSPEKAEVGLRGREYVLKKFSSGYIAQVMQGALERAVQKVRLGN